MALLELIPDWIRILALVLGTCAVLAAVLAYLLVCSGKADDRNTGRVCLTILCTHGIRDEADYRAALAVADVLMDAEPGTAEEACLVRLAEMIEEWEDEHYPIVPWKERVNDENCDD